MNDLNLGLSNIPLGAWLALNLNAPYDDARDELVAPFPPAELMQVVSGLTSKKEFALHGVTIFQALAAASPKPLDSYKNILDFGCGCGRLARVFKGLEGNFTGCDIDERLVEWINSNLAYMNAVNTKPNERLPFKNDQFDCVISISIFSHLNEYSQNYYLQELHRCTEKDGLLFLTIHGERAMERALSEEKIFKMIEVSGDQLIKAERGMKNNQHNFLIQASGHLTRDSYEYGITFIPSGHIYEEWGKYFEIVNIVNGAIHDFQSIVVCRKR